MGSEYTFSEVKDVCERLCCRCSTAISSKNGGGGGRFCTELFKIDGVRRIGGGGLLL